MRTLIDARYVIGYRDGGHVILENAQVVVDGDTVVHVGRDYGGAVDRRIDAGDKLCIPGLIAVHCHFTNSPLTKSFLEDQGVFSGSRHDVHAVMVNGRIVVDAGRMEGVDERAVVRDLQGAAERPWTRVPAHDWAGRTIDGISPSSFPSW